MSTRKALGKGLDALIPTGGDADIQRKNVMNIAVTSIQRNRYQPRTEFDKEKIDQLAQSIKENGVIQPLIVRQSDNGYELIAGERRLRAAAVLGMATVPAVVTEATSRS